MGDMNRSIKIYLDNSSAMESADQLRKRIGSLEEKLISLQTSGEDNTAQFKKYSAELDAQRIKMEKYEATVKDTDRVLKNLSGATYKELIRVKKDVEKQLNNTARGTELYNERLRVHKSITQEVGIAQREMRGEVAAQGSMWGRAADGVNRYLSIIGVVVASLTGATMVISKLKEERDGLESSSANLEALTGLGKEEVDKLTESAKTMSTSITQDGVRVKQSAKEIVESFAVVGSQRPELLKNADALRRVTQDAIYLSIASKDKLEPSTKALTTTLNQFNLKASDSRRVINALAAGSQAGAGNITYLGTAIEKSGTTASLMNIELEQHIGLIEAVAPKYSEASIAGNSLDKVLLKMKENQIGYKNGQFDVNRAIDELSVRFKKGESAGKIFGVEHAKMAEILVQNKSKINSYTEVVTGSTKAIEQARTNSDINEVKRAQAKNKMIAKGIELMELIDPAITGAMNATVHWTGKLVALATWLAKNSGEIATVTATVMVYVAAIKLVEFWHTLSYKSISKQMALTKINTVVEKSAAVAKIALAGATALLSGNIKRAAAAMRVLTATMAVNPFIAVGVVVAALSLGVYKLMTHTTDAEQAMTDYTRKMIDEQTKLDKLYNSLKRAGQGTALRTKLLSEFNTKYGEYLPNLLSEKSNLNEIEQAYRGVTRSMSEHIAKQVLARKITELETSVLEEKTAKITDIRDELSSLPSSVIEDVVRDVVRHTQLGIDIGLSKEKQLVGLWKSIRDSYFGGKNDSISKHLASELEDYLDIVYDTAEKIKVVEKEFKPLVGIDLLSLEPEIEPSVDDVVITSKATVESPEMQNQKKIKVEKTLMQARLKVVDDEIAAKKLKVSQSYEDGALLFETYNKKLEALELEKLNKQLALYNVGSDERKKIEQLIVDYKIKLMDQSFADYTTNLDKEAKADKKRLADKEALYKKLNTELQNYVDTQKKIQQEDLQNQIDSDTDRANTLMSFSAQAGSILGESLTDAETSATDAMYNILMLTLDTLRQTVTMAITEAMVKSIASGAGLAGLPMAIAKIALINIAFGAIKGVIKKPSTSTATSTANGGSSNTGNRVVAGKEEGGYIGVTRSQDGKHFDAVNDPDKRGYVDRPTVIVGEGGREWVASNDALQNPTVAPVIQMLDYSQRAGTIKHINFTEAMRGGSAVRGLETGGSVNAGVSPSTDMQGSSVKENTELISLMRELKSFLTYLLSNPIQAYVSYSQFSKKKDTLDKAKKIGGK